jgi:hypothetical protein
MPYIGVIVPAGIRRHNARLRLAGPHRHRHVLGVRALDAVRSRCRLSTHHHQEAACQIDHPLWDEWADENGDLRLRRVVAHCRTRQAALLGSLCQAMRDILGVLRQVPLRVTGKPRSVIEQAEQDWCHQFAAWGQRLARAVMGIPMKEYAVHCILCYAESRIMLSSGLAHRSLLCIQAALRSIIMMPSALR